MQHYLVVTRPFLNFVRGDIISDATKVSDILKTDYQKFVTKVAAPNSSEG
jgi:hypothetical protein